MMRSQSPMSIVLRVGAAVLLLAGAMLARNQARAARAEADTWQEVVTLRYDAAAVADPSDDGLALTAGEGLSPAQRRATVEYWLGRYDEVAAEGGSSADPGVMFVAANAAFRSAWREIVAGRADASVLDGVLQAYAAVLRADPDRIDAAFNLELVAERQDQVARQRPIAVTAADDEPRDSGPIRTSDLPVGPTIHGLPGGPPVNVQMEEFEILIPREAGQEETEPGRASGRRVRRKG